MSDSQRSADARELELAAGVWVADGVAHELRRFIPTADMGWDVSVETRLESGTFHMVRGGFVPAPGSVFIITVKGGSPFRFEGDPTGVQELVTQNSCRDPKRCTGCQRHLALWPRVVEPYFLPPDPLNNLKP